jgi:hypothetical protein
MRMANRVLKRANGFLGGLSDLDVLKQSRASKVMDRTFSTLFNRNAASALSSMAIMQINA